MVVTYYIKLFCTVADRHNGILMSLLPLVGETTNYRLAKKILDAALLGLIREGKIHALLNSLLVSGYETLYKDTNSSSVIYDPVDTRPCPVRHMVSYMLSVYVYCEPK